MATSPHFGSYSACSDRSIPVPRLAGPLGGGARLAVDGSILDDKPLLGGVPRLSQYFSCAFFDASRSSGVSSGVSCMGMAKVPTC